MEQFIRESFSLSNVYLEVWGCEKALWSFNCGEKKQKNLKLDPHRETSNSESNKVFLMFI